eukprot:scaffold5037_cov114-Isochrysis_galbana.AAC.3
MRSCTRLWRRRPWATSGLHSRDLRDASGECHITHPWGTAVGARRPTFGTSDLHRLRAAKISPSPLALC